LKKIRFRNRKLILILFVCIILIPISNTEIVICRKISNNNNNLNKNNETEYWALIFAVGIYKNHSNQNRLSMLEAADDLYNTLLKYSEWDDDHINIIKGEEATGRNLIRGLLWLIQNEGKNDMSLIYLTTHGSPLKDQNGYPIDLPPKDELDGTDEILVMYDGFEDWYSFIWDDLLNFFLGMIQSKGICLIVDSCYSGGFNDNIINYSNDNKINNNFCEEFSFELFKNNRIILMSSEESTVSYGSYFSFHLIDGFNGIADNLGNNDGINSAEESFNYAQYKVDLIGWQHPTILDNYPGEFPITY
jgi:hypothetical protein